MAIVYKAQDLQNSEIIAVKILRPELSEDEQLINRFNQEASAAASLLHSNIVRTRDVGCDGHIHYIVMDLIEGVTLKEYIDQNKPLKPQEAAKIALDIAKGLQHAHSNGIIHRDIKPHNIIIDKSNTVKIADFGIARIVSDATRTTQYGKDIMGTVYYTSPEQIRGNNIDERTDIYSLGVVLYEMVTGNVPFNGETAVSIAMQHVTKEPEAVSKINKDVPFALDNIIKNAMAKRIENRYKTIDDMIRDLKKYIANYESDIALLAAPSVRRSKITFKKPTEKQQRQRKRELNAILLNILLVILLSTAFAVLAYGIYNIGISIFNNNFVLSQVQTPSVVGYSVDDAKSMLQDKQLVYREISTMYSSTIPKGCIIEQSPAAGETVNEDTLVNVVVSLGAYIIDIPDFFGMDIVEAEYELKSNSYIKVGTKYNYVENSAPKGTIVGQSIDPGSFSLDGSYVTIYFDVSNGVQETTIKMKNFVGYAYSSLEQLASVYNINIGKITYEHSDTVGKDIVLKQSIPEGTEIEKNTTVDFVISLGPLVYAEKTITIDIPSSISVPESGTVYLAIKYIDSNQFIDAFKGNADVVDSQINIKLTGSGTVTYYIYINSTYIESKTVKFS